MTPQQNLALEVWEGWHVWVADHDPLPEHQRSVIDWPTDRIPLASFRNRERAMEYGARKGWRA